MKERSRSDGNAKANPIRDFLKTQSKTLALKVVAALQLLPENHGKNLRLEKLAFYTAKYCDDNVLTLDAVAFQTFLRQHFQFDPMEDSVESVFTGNVSTIFGNLVAFPGPDKHSYRVLDRLLLVAFNNNTTFPDDFLAIIQNSLCLLRLLDSVARKANIKRYQSLNQTHRNEIVFTRKLNIIEDLLLIPKSIVTEDSDIPSKLVNALCTSDLDLDLDIETPFEDNPLLNKPIIVVEDGYIIALPTAILTAIINYIFLEAERLKLFQKLIKAYHNHCFDSIELGFKKIGWRPIKNLKFENLDSGVFISVFLLDVDIYAIVAYIPDRMDVDDTKFANDIVKIKRVILASAKHEIKFLVLATGGYSGDVTFFRIEDLGDDTWIIQFSCFDLEYVQSISSATKLTLWKYAKALKKAKGSLQIISLDPMATFGFFLKNDESFFLSDERTNGISIDSDYGTNIRVSSIQDSDQHTILKQEGEMLGYFEVTKYASYELIYEPIAISPNHLLVLDKFKSPIWIVSQDLESASARDLALKFAESILYWLSILDLVSSLVNVHAGLPIEIDISIDAGLKKTEPQEASIGENNNLDLKYKIQNNGVRGFELYIPSQIINLLIQPNNLGEQVIIRQVIRGLNHLALNESNQQVVTDDQINDAILHWMRNPRQRMILLTPAHVDSRLDPRWLRDPTYNIPDADTSDILQNLTSFLPPERIIPEELISIEEKNRLCHEIVAGLVGHVQKALSEYNSGGLIEYLMNKNESLIFKRELDKIHIPAQIVCLSNYNDQIAQLKKNEERVIQTSLSIRCLIEFAAAILSEGTKLITDDDVDYLLAITEQIIQWGSLSDTLQTGLYNMWMGLLPSGRVGTDKTFYNDYLQSYRDAHLDENLTRQIEKVQAEYDQVKKAADNDRLTSNNVTQELDIAFHQQFKISLKSYYQLHHFLSIIAIASKKSVLIIKKSDLFQEIIKFATDFTEDEFEAALSLMSLKQRESLGKSPKNYASYDIYPWRYNRELSYMRRPIYSFKKENESYVMYGFRHTLVSIDNLLYLLYGGRLNNEKYQYLKGISSKINNAKGKDFRNEVYKWIVDNTKLTVIPHEVQISDLEFGDIDILVWDDSTHLIYSIECKNTHPAKNIYEMKIELDSYFGKSDDEGMISKHVNRHNWLAKHTDQVAKWLKVQKVKPENITSLVVTAFEIPAAYISQKKLPLKIYSFHALKKELKFGSLPIN